MIRNETRGALLATAERYARNPWTRFLGLMGRRNLPAGEALVFPGEKSVHTHFMRFPIDVVFYDRDGVVIEVAHALRPWRFSAIKWTAAGLIELPAGTARATSTQIGDRLNLSPSNLA
ncbi:MAG TPA: DUF192 domain-containing protein [Chloroflexota bacterium]|nr:DUF192 domain-containing protein [Chloroflexota bacterium]